MGGAGDSIEARYTRVEDNGKVTVSIEGVPGPALVKHKSGAVEVGENIVGFMEKDGNNGAIFNQANRKPAKEVTELIANEPFASVEEFVTKLEEAGRGEEPPPSGLSEENKNRFNELKSEIQGMLDDVTDVTDKSTFKTRLDTIIEDTAAIATLEELKREVQAAKPAGDDAKAIQEFKNIYQKLKDFMDEAQSLAQTMNWDEEIRDASIEDAFPYWYYNDKSGTTSNNFIKKYKDDFKHYSSTILQAIHQIENKASILNEMQDINTIFHFESWESSVGAEEPLGKLQDKSVLRSPFIASKSATNTITPVPGNPKETWEIIIDDKLSLSVFLLIFFNFFQGRDKEPFINFPPLVSSDPHFKARLIYNNLKENEKKFASHIDMFESFYSLLNHFISECIT